MIITTPITVIEEPLLEVEVTANVSYDDGSFDYAGTHCNHGQSGTFTPFNGGSYEVDGEIKWDKTLYSDEQNKLIESYIKENSHYGGDVDDALTDAASNFEI